VSIMALGAMDKFPDSQIYIVPCGLIYFSGHRFRSHVCIEFGHPLQITPLMLASYRENKRKACDKLLQVVDKRLRSVTLNFPSYDIMQQIQTARRLYQPKTLNLTADQYLKLIRRFTQGYLRLADHPEVKAITGKIEYYNSQLQKFGLEDYQISDGELGKSIGSIFILGIRILYLTVIVLCSLPGIVFNIPVMAIAKYLSLKEAKKAKQGSDVKIEGKDVIASYKVLVGLVLFPTAYWIYFWVAMYLYGWRGGMFIGILLPFLSYACIKMMEEGVSVWKSSVPVLFDLFRSSYHEQIVKLRETRENLQIQVRGLVKQLGPEMGEEFWADKIISPDQIELLEQKGKQSVFKIKRKKYKQKAYQEELDEELFDEMSYLGSNN